MNRANYYNYIEEKLHTLAQRITTGGKLNMLSLHLHSESFYQHFFNLLHTYNLVNLNQESQNVEAIDLIDRDKKIVIQVSSTATKTKIEGALSKASIADYSDHTFKFISIAKDASSLRKNTYVNPHSIGFQPSRDIYDIASILNEIKDFDIDKLMRVYDFIEKELGENTSQLNPNLTTKSSTNDSSFIGREDEVKAIDEMLESANSLLLINGIGGIGKSSLANHYLYTRENKFDYYGFIDGLDSFISEFRNSLDLKAEKEKELYHEIISKLQGLKGKKLLVIDNVEDIESHKELMEMILSLEKYDYKILFTSRRKIKQINSYYLGTLLPKDAQKLFLSHFSTDETEKVDKIIEYLGLHTLFIGLVAETVRNEGYTLDDIIEKFEDENGGLSKIEYIDEESGEELTFNENLQELFSMQNLNDENILLLKRLSVLPSIDIELSFLEEILGKERLKGRLNFLVGRGWLIENEGSYKLHQIIKEFLLANYAPCFEEIKDITDNIIKLMTNNEDMLVAMDNVNYLMYFESLENIFTIITIKHIKISTFFIYYGNIFRAFGIYDKAKRCVLKALRIRKKLLGDTRPTSVAYNNLAEIHHSLGSYKKAKKLYFKVLEIRKKEEGKYHRDTATSYNNLADLYREMKDYKESEKLHKKALEIRIRILGEQSDHTASSYHNLGLLYEDKKDFDRAKELYLKAFRIWEKVLNKNHPTLGSSNNSLAILYAKQGDFQKAYEYMKIAVMIREEVLPSNHPSLKDSKKNLEIIEQELKQLIATISTKKSNRNNPCPCNSGKKYKKCCGKPK